MHSITLRTRYALLIFAILLTTYVYILPKQNWNSRSRIALTRAIVEEGVFHIDSFHEGTGDKAFFNGHYYTDKSIGPSMVAVPVYFLYRLVASVPLFDFLAQYQVVNVLATWFSTSIPSALLGVALFLFVSEFATKLSYAVLVSLLYGLATSALPFSTVVFQHQLSAAGLFIAFYILWKIACDGADSRWFWIVGILAGLTIISDYWSAVLICLIILWSVFKTREIKTLIPIALGALPFVLILLIYNGLSFGNPLTLGYALTEWDAVQGQGLFGVKLPTLDGLWGITFSPFRGLFFVSPVLLLGFHGFYIMWKKKFDLSVLFLCLVLVIATFLFNASAVMWWAGYSIGPRYMLSVVPFLAVPMIFSLNRLMPTTWSRIFVISLIVLSCANVWIQTLSTDQLVPDTVDSNVDPSMEPSEWILQQYEQGNILDNPLFEWSIPKLIEGDITNTLGSFLFGTENLATTLIPLFLIWGMILLSFRVSAINSQHS